jgi:hypothetical protein
MTLISAVVFSMLQSPVSLNKSNMPLCKQPDLIITCSFAYNNIVNEAELL